MHILIIDITLFLSSLFSSSPILFKIMFLKFYDTKYSSIVSTVSNPYTAFKKLPKEYNFTFKNDIIKQKPAKFIASARHTIEGNETTKKLEHTLWLINYLPVDPVEPANPVAPFGPTGPAGPVAPAGPALPGSPLAPEFPV